MVNRADFAKEVSEKIIKLMEEGKAPWQIPFDPGQPNTSTPVNEVTGKPYRGINFMSLFAEQLTKGHEDNRWMTYKQATEAGGQVRKGQKSTLIEFWDFSKFERQQEAIKNGAEIPEKELLKGPLVIYSHVFNGSQIDGLRPYQAPTMLPEEERIQFVDDLVKQHNATVEYGGNKAYYNSGTDIITMPDFARFKSAEDHAATLLHEFGHWTGHPDRLDRKLGNKFGTPDYAREELRAEIFSMQASSRLGILHNPENHAAYTKSWLQILKDDPGEILKACADVEQMLKFAGLEKSLIHVPSKEQEKRNEETQIKSDEKAKEKAATKKKWKTKSKAKSKSAAVTTAVKNKGPNLVKKKKITLSM